MSIWVFQVVRCGRRITWELLLLKKLAITMPGVRQCQKMDYGLRTYEFFSEFYKEYGFDKVKKVIKYNFDETYGTVDNKAILDFNDDAAYVNWGPEWRMPTYEQMNELFSQCTQEWKESNGVYGRLFTGPNGNTLFLPAAGNPGSESLRSADSVGNYWSRTLGFEPYCAYMICFYLEGEQRYSLDRLYGLNVRAVRVP